MGNKEIQNFWWLIKNSNFFLMADKKYSLIFTLYDTRYRNVAFFYVWVTPYGSWTRLQINLNLPVF
jgi:hypothetical protein